MKLIKAYLKIFVIIPAMILSLLGGGLGGHALRSEIEKIRNPPNDANVGNN